MIQPALEHHAPATAGEASKPKMALIAAMAIVSMASAAARADDFNHWEVRGRVVRIDTAGGSDGIGALGLPADVIIVQSKTVPEVDVSYFFSRNISAELVLTYPQKMDVAINAGGIGHIGTVSVLPPDLMAQYHFFPDGAFDPYLGAGLNLTWITKVDLRAPSVAPLSLDVSKISVGPVAQFGLDYKFDRKWVVNVDVKYESMGFDLTSSGNKVSNLHVDPWLFSLGAGYKF
jgi:outer membrane protein